MAPKNVDILLLLLLLKRRKCRRTRSYHVHHIISAQLEKWTDSFTVWWSTWRRKKFFNYFWMSKKSPDKQLLDYTESDITGIDVKNGNVCHHDSSKSGKNLIPTFCIFFCSTLLLYFSTFITHKVRFLFHKLGFQYLLNLLTHFH